MAKGFTVKAAAPKSKAPDWDYDAIRERMKGKKEILRASFLPFVILVSII